MAELDILMAFAEVAEGTGEGPMCRPHLLPDDAEPVSASFANLLYSLQCAIDKLALSADGSESWSIIFAARMTAGSKSAYTCL